MNWPCPSLRKKGASPPATMSSRKRKRKTKGKSKGPPKKRRRKKPPEVDPTADRPQYLQQSLARAEWMLTEASTGSFISASSVGTY